MFTTNELHRELENKIRNRILVGKLPSVAELTRMYEVSHNTVQRVIDRLKLQGFVHGHHGKGVFVNESITARHGGSVLVIMKITSMKNPFYIHVLHELKTKFTEQNVTFDVSLGIDDDPSKYDAVIIIERILTPGEFSTLYSRIPKERIIALNWEDPGLVQIGNDNHAGGYMAMKHLYENGHRLVGVITRELAEHPRDFFSERWRGVTDFVTEHQDMQILLETIPENIYDNIFSVTPEVCILGHQDIR